MPSPLTLAFPSAPGRAVPGLMSPGIPVPQAAAGQGEAVAQRPPRQRARVQWSRVSGTVYVPPPISLGWTVIRRQPSGAFFGGIASSAPVRTPVTGGTACRRLSRSRAVWHGQQGTVFPATLPPGQVPRPSRRAPSRALWHGTAAPAPAAAGPSGTVQPRAAVPVPRRAPARGTWTRPSPAGANAASRAVIIVSLGAARLPWTLGGARNST